MAATREQKDRYGVLLRELRGMGCAAVAFSGGVDSSFLLHAAREALGGGVLAVTFAAPYSPRAEIAGARDMAISLGVNHHVVETPVPEAVRENPPDRCYLCKRALFGRLRALAAEQGIEHVLDGTNLDDLDDYRPGLRAVRELGVRSPLLDARLTKRDIRDLSREFGLPTWDLPAGACLLTRLPHGTFVDEGELERIDRGEHFLKSIGFRQVRLRSHGSLARIELPPESIGACLDPEVRGGIDAELKSLGYAHVAVDLGGYRMGGMNLPSEETEAKE